jgi:hypothetical protein
MSINDADLWTLPEGEEHRQVEAAEERLLMEAEELGIQHEVEAVEHCYRRQIDMRSVDTNLAVHNRSFDIRILRILQSFSLLVARERPRHCYYNRHGFFLVPHNLRDAHYHRSLRDRLNWPKDETRPREDSRCFGVHFDCLDSAMERGHQLHHVAMALNLAEGHRIQDLDLLARVHRNQDRPRYVQQERQIRRQTTLA